MTTTHFSLEVGVEHVIVTLSALLRCSRAYCKGDGRPFKAVHLHSLEVMGIRASTRSGQAHTLLTMLTPHASKSVATLLTDRRQTR